MPDYEIIQIHKFSNLSLNLIYNSIVLTFATADRLVVFAGQQGRLVDDVVIRFIVTVRRETVTAHLFTNRQWVFGYVPVVPDTCGVTVVVVDVVVRWEVHEYVLHVDGDTERVFEYWCAYGLMFFTATQSQNNGAYAEQDQRGSCQHADENFHHSITTGSVVFFLVRRCTQKNHKLFNNLFVREELRTYVRVCVYNWNIIKDWYKITGPYLNFFSGGGMFKKKDESIKIFVQ